MTSTNDKDLLLQIQTLSDAIDHHKALRSLSVPGLRGGSGRGLVRGSSSAGAHRVGSLTTTSRNMKLVLTSPVQAVYTPVTNRMWPAGAPSTPSTPASTSSAPTRPVPPTTAATATATPNSRPVGGSGDSALSRVVHTGSHALQSPSLGTPGWSDIPNSPSLASGYISKRQGKNLQLINKDVLSTVAAAHAQNVRTTEEKKRKRAEVAAAAKAQRRKARTEALTTRNIVNVGGTHYTKSRNGKTIVVAKAANSRNVTINGVLFTMDAAGKKLVRAGAKPADETPSRRGQMAPLLPKKISISGDLYVRTKRGNLVRAPLLASQTSRIRRSTVPTPSTRRRTPRKKQFCQFYNQFGKCKKGYLCPYVHDPKHVVVCWRHLRNSCSKGSECPFSHLLIPEKVPLCVHFARGNCSNSECRYLHSRVAPTECVCRAFALENYCPQGSKCKQRHVFECPDYCPDKGTGSCPRGDKCRLAHLDPKKRKHSAANEREVEILNKSRASKMPRRNLGDGMSADRAISLDSEDEELDARGGGDNESLLFPDFGGAADFAASKIDEEFEDEGEESSLDDDDHEEKDLGSDESEQEQDVGEEEEEEEENCDAEDADYDTDDLISDGEEKDNGVLFCHTPRQQQTAQESLPLISGESADEGDDFGASFLALE